MKVITFKIKRTEMGCSYGKMGIFTMGSGAWDYKMEKEYRSHLRERKEKAFGKKGFLNNGFDDKYI